MAKGISGSVDAGAFAVPDRKNALLVRGLIKIDLLGTEHRGRCEILIYTGMETDVGGVGEFFGLDERLIDASKRRSAVSRHESRGVEARDLVTPSLAKCEAHQSLGARNENAALL